MPACPALPRAQCVGPAHCSKIHKHLENNLFPLPRCRHDCFPKQCWNNAYFQKALSFPCDMLTRAADTRGPWHSIHPTSPSVHPQAAQYLQGKPGHTTAWHCPAPAHQLPAGPWSPSQSHSVWAILAGGWHIPAPKPGPDSSPTNKALGSWPQGTRLTALLTAVGPGGHSQCLPTVAAELCQRNTSLGCLLWCSTGLTRLRSP